MTPAKCLRQRSRKNPNQCLGQRLVQKNPEQQSMDADIGLHALPVPDADRTMKEMMTIDELFIVDCHRWPVCGDRYLLRMHFGERLKLPWRKSGTHVRCVIFDISRGNFKKARARGSGARCVRQVDRTCYPAHKVLRFSQHGVTRAPRGAHVPMRIRCRAQRLSIQWSRSVTFRARAGRYRGASSECGGRHGFRRLSAQIRVRAIC